MMLLTSSWSLDASLFILTLLFVLHKYISRNYDHWRKKGVVYITPKPFIGNLFDVVSFRTTIAHWQQKIYNSTDQPYVGVFAFHKPVLTLRSPQLIKQVLVKHFDNFMNRTVLNPDHNQVVANALFFAKDENWKLVRSKMTPAFTSGKLKAMFSTVNAVGHETIEYIKKSKGQLEVKELSSKYTTEIIARTAFGINAHCFDKEDCDFRKIAGLLFVFDWKTAIGQTAYFYMHSLANLLRLEFVDNRSVEFLRKVFWQTIKYREKQHVKGNDLIDIIIELRRNDEFREKISFESDKVVAQPFMFFAAAVDTTSHLIAFTLYELCLHPLIQEKLREEILNHLKENKEIDFDSLKDMKYLEMCILESLRKYPAVPFLDRICKEDFTIPGTDTVIDKGTLVYIPLLGLHYDEKYFPDPHKYKPERFADSSVYNKDGLYYLPFGEGPRMCLGERFAMMNTKVALINILSQFLIEPVPATPVPLKYTPKYFTLKSKDDLLMKFVAISK
nr:cytochrome P450 [Pharsalia antennata]